MSDNSCKCIRDHRPQWIQNRRWICPKCAKLWKAILEPHTRGNSAHRWQQVLGEPAPKPMRKVVTRIISQEEVDTAVCLRAILFFNMEECQGLIGTVCYETRVLPYKGGFLIRLTDRLETGLAPLIRKELTSLEDSTDVHFLTLRTVDQRIINLPIEKWDHGPRALGPRCWSWAVVFDDQVIVCDRAFLVPAPPMPNLIPEA